MTINAQDRQTAADILEKIMVNEGVYEKVFGPRLLDQLVYDRNIDNDIHVIDRVYGYYDASSVFTRKIDRSEFKQISRIIFKFQELAPNNRPSEG